jgi:hypothetical protein
MSKIQATVVWKMVKRRLEFLRQEDARKRNSDRMPELDDIPWENLPRYPEVTKGFGGSTL